MLNTTLQTPQTTGTAVTARAAVVATNAYAWNLGNGGLVLGDARGVTQVDPCETPRTSIASPIARTRSAAIAAWSAIARKSMSVPAFHDRWPLCSST